MFTYLLILAGILIISPIVLFFAVRQEIKFKEKVRKFCLVFLAANLLLGFSNWEFFEGEGRSGFSLALQYPYSLLWVFFVITAGQIILLLFNKKHFGTIASVLNFLNTIVLFAGLIWLSNILGRQAVSYASVSAVFIMLILNVVFLVFINKDKNLLKKYPF